MPHPDLPAEQAYVDRAYEHLERMRETIVHAADNADGAAISRESLAGA
jgi:hypothetical protein